MIKRIITVLLTLALLSGCGSKAEPGDSGPPPSSASVSAGSKTEEIFTYDDLHTFLMEKPIECEYKDKEAIQETGLEISEIRDLTYTLTIQSNEEFHKVADIAGTFTAVGKMEYEKGNNKITAEPVHFRATATKVSNGLTFSKYGIDPMPLIKPTNPPDLDNLLQYDFYRSDIRADPVSIAKYYFESPPSENNPHGLPDFDNPAGELDLNDPELRIVVIKDHYPDEENFGRMLDIEFYKGENYECSASISIHCYFEKPRIAFSLYRSSGR